MRKRDVMLCVGGLMLLAQSALAERIVHNPETLRVPLKEQGALFGTVGTAEKPSTIRQGVIPQSGVSAKRSSYMADDGRLKIYLNRQGGVFTPNQYVNDSRSNISTVPKQTSSIPAWTVSDDNWSKVKSCVESSFADFQVSVTDVDPGKDNHIEAVVAGSPVDLGLADGIGGIAPFAYDCSVISNAVVFAFAEVYDNKGEVDVEGLCTTISQEVAHGLGLDHTYQREDIMSYLRYTDLKYFADAEASCGEFSPRKCGIGGNVCSVKQNSYGLLNARVGDGEDKVDITKDSDDESSSGCNAGNGAGGLLSGLLLALGLVARKRT